jgi:hypothetical protein
LQTRLGLPLANAFETAADYLRGSSAALMARRNPPSLNASMQASKVTPPRLTALRRESLTPDLPGDAVERLFALGFTLEQLRRNFEDLEQCVTDNARSTIGGDQISLLIVLSRDGGESIAARIKLVVTGASVAVFPHDRRLLRVIRLAFIKRSRRFPIYLMNAGSISPKTS